MPSKKNPVLEQMKDIVRKEIKARREKAAIEYFDTCNDEKDYGDRSRKFEDLRIVEEGTRLAQDLIFELLPRLI